MRVLILPGWSFTTLITLIFLKVLYNIQHLSPEPEMGERLESHLIVQSNLLKWRIDCIFWVRAPCLIVSNIYSSLAVIRVIVVSESNEKKFINGELHPNESAWYESGFASKKKMPEPRRMEQLNCGLWGFHMRTPHIFINFPNESIRVALYMRGTASKQ